MKAVAVLIFVLLGTSFAARVPNTPRVFPEATLQALAIHIALNHVPMVEPAQQLSAQSSSNHETPNSGRVIIQDPPQRKVHLSLLGLVGLGSLVAGLIMKR